MHLPFSVQKTDKSASSGCALSLLDKLCRLIKHKLVENKLRIENWWKEISLLIILGHKKSCFDRQAAGVEAKLSAGGQLTVFSVEIRKIFLGRFKSFSQLLTLLGSLKNSSTIIWLAQVCVDPATKSIVIKLITRPLNYRSIWHSQ